jgi:D-alanyl-lipoteichoic acid acyltransferase DltB (MBOAT superfamily)
MLRCINNNATILGFWKGWHASYNRWLVRYIYVPLGGAKYRLLNVWVVFGFVGAWHDKIAWHLIHWAWIFALFLAPEIAAHAIGAKFYGTPEKRRSRTYVLGRAICGGAMIHVLVAGNMVGYVVGLDGLSQLGKLYMDDLGSAMKFFGITMAMMSAAAHLGFEQRAREDEAKAKARIGGAEVEGVGTVVAGRRKGGKKEGRGTAGDEAPAGDSDAGDGGR